MANRFMKRHSISLIREMQIKPPVRMAVHLRGKPLWKKWEIPKEINN
jgi:hypothetical protein